MLMNPSFFVYLTLTFSGVLLVASSSSWFGAWVGMEINLLGFLPLILLNHKPKSTETSLKYFLIQASSSLVVLQLGILIPSENNLFLFLATSALLLKMGAAPFHFWFPLVAEGLNWEKMFLLSTVQKISPLLLLTYSFSNSTAPLLFISAALSSVVGALGGLNEMLLRKLLSFSSINHTGWMIISISLGNSLWVLYFILYFLILLITVKLFENQNIFHTSQLFKIPFNNTTRLSLSLSLLSLGGLPPLLGFLPKWVVIQTLVNFHSFMILLVLLMSSVITLYFYLRLSLKTFNLTSSTTLKSFSLPLDTKNYSFIFLNVTGLVLFSPLCFTMF